MSNKLKALVDPLAGGEHRWFMAGGGAAWWHISSHMMDTNFAHDMAYFAEVEAEIFPGDIEGAALTGVHTVFPGRQGQMDIQLSELAKAEFDQIVATHCVDLDGILVYKPESIILRYRTASDPSKQEKRDIRVGMLQLILDGEPITRQGVQLKKPKVSMLGGLAGGMGRLRKTGDRK